MKKLLALIFLLTLSASAQNSHYPPNTGGGGVTTINGESGDVNLLAGTGISITPSGQNITITNTGGGGANQSLSNLTSPTALNQDLIFNESGNAQILTADSSSGPSANLNMLTGNGIGQNSGSFSIGAGNSDTGNGGVVEFSGGNVTTATANQSNGGQVSIFAGNTASTNINAEGGSIFIAAGNAPIPGNSGGVSIYDGNGLGGINIGPNLGVNILDNAGVQGILIASTDRELDDSTGSPAVNFTSNLILTRASPNLIQWQDGSQGTSGQCLVSTDTTGSGSWATCPGGGGANTALSNLVSTAVNAAINPGAPNTINLGTTALPWSNVESENFTLTDGTNDLFVITQSTNNIGLNVQAVAATENFEIAGGTTTTGTNGGAFGIVGNSAGPTGGNGGDLILENSDAASPSGSGGNVVLLLDSPSGGGQGGEIGLAGHISLNPGGSYFYFAPGSVAPQTGLGSGATASVSVNSQDQGGILTLASGTTGLAAGAQVIVTFGTPYNSGETPVIQLTPANSNAGLDAVHYYVTATATGFTLNFATASLLSTTYIFNYAIMGLL